MVASIDFRYTSVFPEPVTPSSRNVWNLPPRKRRFNLLVRFELVRIERAGRDIAAKDARGRFRFERDQVSPRQRTRGLAGAFHG